MTAAGADPARVRWWNEAIANQFFQIGLGADHRLPFDAVVYHYAPLDFMRAGGLAGSGTSTPPSLTRYFGHSLNLVTLFSQRRM